ncbi:hypothetical protein Ae706Ps2_6578c [Pseudonocardia sp. Ae706_Ps2]|nr:hypothetical protein Ae706Ps2_6578c [Pseudonocardia sp. Ae706_Ps2]
MFLVFCCVGQATSAGCSEVSCSHMAPHSSRL